MMIRIALAAALLLPAAQEDVAGILQSFEKRYRTARAERRKLILDLRENLDTYIKRHPDATDLPLATYHLAGTYNRLGDFRGFAEKLRAFLRDHPDADQAPDARFALGEALTRIDNDAGARAAFETFLEAHPKDERAPTARIYIAVTFQNEGKYAEAEQALHGVRRDYPGGNTAWEALSQLALIYHLQERNREAREALTTIYKECKDPIRKKVAGHHLAGYLMIGEQPAPLGVKDVSGAPFSPELHRGKVVILHFFDLSDPQALRDFGILKRALKDAGDKGLQVLGVCVSPDPRDTEVLRSKALGITWPVHHDRLGFKGKAARHLDAQGLPFVLLLDRKGTLRFFNLSGRDLLRTTAKLLEEK
jgi:tetratricopeptide (TPR) repeat protein